MKILIIDDNHETSQLVAEYLNSVGYDTTAITDPVDSFELIKSCFWDAVICDIEMPKIKGTDLIKVLKETSPDTKMFMLSGNINLGSKGETYKYVEAFLEKPMGLFKINHFLDCHLKSKKKSA